MTAKRTGPEYLSPRVPGDEELVARYQEGDVAAFEELLRRHRRSVYNFIYRFLGNSPRADDLFQDVFLRVIRSIDSFRHESKFTTWLFRITRNICIDDLRRKRLANTISLHEGREGVRPSAMAESIPDRAPPVEELLEQRELVEILRAGLVTLTVDQREVFLLREQAGLPFKEIAKIVGCTRNTAKSRMRYALDRLRKHLARYEPELRRRREAGG